MNRDDCNTNNTPSHVALVVRDISPEDYMSPIEQLAVLDEPEGTISLPVEIFSAVAQGI